MPPFYEVTTPFGRHLCAVGELWLGVTSAAVGAIFCRIFKDMPAPSVLAITVCQLDRLWDCAQRREAGILHGEPSAWWSGQ